MLKRTELRLVRSLPVPVNAENRLLSFELFTPESSFLCSIPQSCIQRLCESAVLYLPAFLPSVSRLLHQLIT